MRILCFNWRDIKNPAAGGAEVYTHEILKRLAKKNDVTLLCAGFKGGAGNEMLDGINIARKGNALTVYLEAFWHYWNVHRGKTDLIIDECNTLPFFTALYAKERTVFLIHQLAVEFWNLELPPPFSWIGRFLEPFYLRLYSKHLTVTVSDSTRQDLARLGFRNIKVIPNGSNVKPRETVPKKAKEPVILFVGRLKKAKKPLDALQAMARIHEKLPKANGFIVGDGYLKDELKRQAPDYIKVLGRASAKEKYMLMERAHVLLVPGIREGWGQVVIEANAFGTPCVGYDVPGLRDSIQDGKTGYLVQTGDADAMAEKAIVACKNKTMRKESVEWSRNFDWDGSEIGWEKIVGR